SCLNSSWQLTARTISAALASSSACEMGPIVWPLIGKPQDVLTITLLADGGIVLSTCHGLGVAPTAVATVFPINCLRCRRLASCSASARLLMIQLLWLRFFCMTGAT